MFIMLFVFIFTQLSFLFSCFYLQFFNQVLILGKEDKKLFIATKVYDLIYELYHVCSRVLLSVLPQLEFKLKSPDEHERMGCVSLLARMFSEKDSQLAVQHRQLWRAFLGRQLINSSWTQRRLDIDGILNCVLEILMVV